MAVTQAYTPYYLYQRLVRFGDADSAGIVWTPRFVEFCMEAAESWLKSVAGADWYTMNQSLNLGSPVVHLELDFIAPMVPGDECGIEVQVERVGRSSLGLKLQGLKLAQTGANDQIAVNNQIAVNKEKSFSARFTFSFIDKEKGSSIPIPLQYRKRIEDYQTRCDAFTHERLQEDTQTPSPSLSPSTTTAE